MIVAINKTDKPEADPERVKRELMSENVIVESMGGDTPSVNTSATTQKGIPELLEMILLVAEMEDLKTDESKTPQGVIIESYLDQKRGPIATLILKEGILREGDIIGTNSAFGKIKSMEDFQGKPVKEAHPSDPIVVLGLNKVPGMGENFKLFKTSELAKLETKDKKISFSSVEIARHIATNCCFAGE